MQGAPGKDGDVGAQGPSGPAVSKEHKTPTFPCCIISTKASITDTSPDTTSLLISRVLLVREESRDLLDLLDSRVFQDPRVPLVRLASLESRY